MSVRPYILAVMVPALLSACVDQRASTPQAMELGLSDVQGITPPSIPLAPVSLTTQAEFDAFEKAQLDRMSPGDLIPILENLAADAKPADNPQDVILLQRLALLHLRSGQGGARLQKAFAVADRLRQEAGKSPDTLFLLSQITQILLRRGSDGAFHLSPQRLDIAQRLATSWEALVLVAPDYVGPHGRKTEDIKADLEALRAALDGMDKHPASGAPPAPGASLSPAGALAVEANRTLREINVGTDGERISLCDSWRKESAKNQGGTAGRLGSWLTLRCSWALKSPDRGLTALTALVKDGDRVAPCVWLSRLPGGNPEILATLKSAMKERGLSGCEPGGG